VTIVRSRRFERVTRMWRVGGMNMPTKNKKWHVIVERNMRLEIVMRM
jgi:hypothetical protein